MKLRNVLAVGASLAVLVGMLAGGNDAAFAQGQARPGRGGSPIMAALKTVTLTDAQQEQIKTISKKYRDERQELTKAAAGDAGAAAGGGRGRMSPEAQAKVAALADKEAAEVKAVLTAEQQTQFQTAFEGAKAEQAFGGVLEPLALTDEQKTKVMPILKEAAPELTKLRADTTLDRQARTEKTTAIWNSVKEKMRPILTADQQKTLDEIKTLRGGGARGGNRGAQAPGA